MTTRDKATKVSATRGVHRERRKQKPQADNKSPLKVLKKNRKDKSEGSAPGFEDPTLLGLADSREAPDAYG